MIKKPCCPMSLLSTTTTTAQYFLLSDPVLCSSAAIYIKPSEKAVSFESVYLHPILILTKITNKQKF